MPTELLTRHETAETSRELLKRLTEGYGGPDFAVRFWDGNTWAPNPSGSPRFTLVLQHPGALRKMFWPPHKTPLAEAYIYGDYDIEGEIDGFFGLIQFLLAQDWPLAERLRLAYDLWRLPSQGLPHTGRQAAHLRGRKRSLERDRQAISYHYDISNDFFALWLDRRMVYTCAYFGAADESLEVAQERKLDYVCRKLRLRPGERLLDIGCGWGGLALYAAQHYGVEALGVTLSQRQVEWANERIRQVGMEGRCRVEYRDYREVEDSEGYDKVASIGIAEHLGEAMLPIFFQGAYRLLCPGGVFLNHGITLRAGVPYPRWTKFARDYVFPDGEVRPVLSSLRAAEAAGFEIRDVESLREHYALTLQHWVRRLEEHHEEARHLTDEATYRIFRLYLAGARQGFLAGTYNLHQSLLAKPDRGRSGLPLTRADWYTSFIPGKDSTP